MFSIFKNERGDVVQFILIMAALSIILAFAFPYLKDMVSKSTDKTLRNTELVFEQPAALPLPPAPPPPPIIPEPEPLPPPPPVNQPPTVPLTVAINPGGVLYTTTNVSFSASGSTDPDGDTFRYEWKLVGGSWSSSLPSTYAEGNYRGEVRAVDSKGASSGSKSFSFEVIGNTAPTRPTSILVNNQIINQTTMVTANGSADDGRPSDLRYEYKVVFNGTVYSDWKSTSSSFTPVNSGYYTIYARAIDLQGLKSPEFSVTLMFRASLNPRPGDREPCDTNMTVVCNYL